MKAVDVLVITPPRKALVNNIIAKDFPPNNQGIDCGPLRLAAVIEEKFSTGYFPFYYTQYNYYHIDEDAIKSVFEMYSPKVLVIATDYYISNRTTSTFNAGIQIGELYKKHYRQGKLIFLGKHAMIKPKEFFEKSDSVDVVINSEGEMVINNIIQYLLEDRIEDLDSIPNIYFKNKDKIMQTIKEEHSIDLNILPVPAYHLLVPHLQTLLNKEVPYGDKISLTLRTSCGCIYNCPYCGGIDNWNKYRTRNGENVKLDIEHAYKYLGESAEFVFLDDELFTYDKNHVKAIAKVFNEKEIRLSGILTHVNFWDQEIAQEISSFSTGVIFGGENFNDNVLKDLNKHQDVAKLLLASELAKNNNLVVRIEYIVGLPYESKNTIIHNLNFIFNSIVHNRIDYVIPYILVPHPGTKYYENRDNYGITIMDSNYDNYIEEGNYPVYKTKSLNRQQIYVYYLLLKTLIIQSRLLRNNIPKLEGLGEYTCSEELFSDFYDQMER